MQRYPLYIFDLDGTLYRGHEAIPHGPETVTELKAAGALIRYLTNNSGQTREFYRAKLERMGYPVDTDEVESSAHGAAAYLGSQGLARPFVVGEPGLVETCRQEGLNVVNANPLGEVSVEGEESDAVLVGICRAFTYDLMSEAMQRLRAGHTFVATNPDATFPLEGDRLVPGAGSVLAAIKTCSERVPFVVGKPNPFLIHLILQQAGIAAADALVVGDRIDTDIASGVAAGCPTHLVLTGVTREAPPNQPYSPDLRGLL